MAANWPDVICHASLFNVTGEKTSMVVSMEKRYPYAPKPYVHLAMTHGAGHAHSTILGKNSQFCKAGLTSFGAARICYVAHSFSATP
jgi:hypothetical protein